MLVFLQKHEHIATSYPTLINQRTLTIDPRVSFLFDQHLTGSLQDFQDLAQLYTSNNTWEQIIADHYGSVTDLKAGDVLIWSGRGLGAWRSLRSVFEVADKEVAQALATSTESVVYQWTKKEGWFTGQPVLLPDGHQAYAYYIRYSPLCMLIYFGQVGSWIFDSGTMFTCHSGTESSLFKRRGSI